VFIETDIGGGSGVVFDDDGHIVTNYHVIEYAKDVHVRLADGGEVQKTEILGFDREADIALLVVRSDEKSALKPLTVGSSARLSVGDPVFAIGYPFEGGSAVPASQMTSGIVSGRRAGIASDVQYLETDADFSHGLSGGALVDRKGRLVGMPSFILSSGASLGLALSGEDVSRLGADIIAGISDERPLKNWQEKVTDHIEDVGDSVAYQVDLETGDKVRFVLEPGDGAFVSLLDPLGFNTFAGDDDVDASSSQQEVLVYEAESTGPYMVLVTSEVPQVRYELSAPVDFESVPRGVLGMRRFLDDEAGLVNLASPFIGELQYPGDRDTIRIQLPVGASVAIRLETWNFDGYLTIGPGGADENAKFDDNSGRGVFGTDPLIRLTPKTSAARELTISSRGFVPASGFYRLTLEKD
jgi:hypothetical protein